MKNWRLFQFICTVSIIVWISACTLGDYTITRKNDDSASEGQEASESESQFELEQATQTPVVIEKQPAATPSIKVEPPAAGMANALGRVLWNDEVVPNAQVRLCEDVGMFSGCEGTIQETTTDETGYYLFANVPPGEYVLVVGAVDADRWIYSTSGSYGFSGAKQNLLPDDTLVIGDFYIYKFDLVSSSPTEDEQVSAGTPTLQWEAYPGAVRYEVYLAADGGSSFRDKVEQNEFTPTNPLLNCGYTWSVEAFNEAGIKLAEEDGYNHFEVISQPASCSVVLVSPSDGASIAGTGIELVWEAHPLADHYKLYCYDKDSNYIVDGVDLTETSYTIPTIAPASQYTWYVNVYDEPGSYQQIARSDFYEFTVTGP